MKRWRILLVLVFAFPLTALVARGQDSDTETDKTPGLNASLVSALDLRGIGPAFMSGRIVGHCRRPCGPQYLVCGGGLGRRVEDDELGHDVVADL